MFEVGKIYDSSEIQKKISDNQNKVQVINHKDLKFSVLVRNESTAGTVMFSFERHPGYNQFKCSGRRDDVL